MAEDDTPKRTDGDEETPPIAVPSHDSLPLPPDVSFRRPTLGRATPVPTARPGARRDPAQGGPSTQSDNAARLGVGLSAGITLAASVIVGFLVGQWIDHRWNHSATPWGTLVMSLAGVAAGFLNLFRILTAGDKPPKPK